MATITVCDTLLTGNMGDGWRDDVEATAAYAAWLQKAYQAHIAETYPEAVLDVRIETQRASGSSGTLAIVSDLSGREETALKEQLSFVRNETWERFCASDEADTLLHTDAE